MNSWLGRVGQLWLAVTGWRAEGRVPPGTTKLVFIAAPHTSNWDLPHMLAIAWVLGIRPSWMGKHTLFRAPFGGIMRALGGVPVDRRAPSGMVGQMAAEFARRDRLALVIPPEGTRARAEHWKSGFHRIAQAAQVPIACGYLDYKDKRGGIGPVFHPDADPDADVERLNAFYSAIAAKYPDKVGPVRFRRAAPGRRISSAS